LGTNRRRLAPVFYSWSEHSSWTI